METEDNKKILIALDYDPCAEKVAETGYALAQQMGAEVVLMHVISDSVIYSSPGHVTIVGFAGCMHSDSAEEQESGKDALKRAAQQFLDKTKQLLGDDSVQTMVCDGDCAEAILKTAADVNAGIIVLGYNGHKGLERKILGSVAERVLHHSPIPLLIVPLGKTI